MFCKKVKCSLNNDTCAWTTNNIFFGRLGTLGGLGTLAATGNPDAQGQAAGLGTLGGLGTLPATSRHPRDAPYEAKTINPEF